MSYFSDPRRRAVIAKAIQEEHDPMAKFTPITDDNTPSQENDDMPNRTKAGMAGEFQKFKGIPMPEGRSTRESKYAWDSLDVGESFFVPDAKPDTFNTLTSNRNKKEKAKNGDKAKRFTARKYTHEGVNGVMVWRVA